MKKLDLHIHSIATKSDSEFTFSLPKLKEYVQMMKIQGIAITNHNLFNKEQYETIENELSGICTVLPGIEINVGIHNIGHLICITEINDIEDFSLRCQTVEDKIISQNDKISLDELKLIFPNLDKYLWIPHYDKKPYIDKQILVALQDYIQCGEVGSVRKFVYCQKDDNSLIPVYFSDLRPQEEIDEFPTRQTYFDIDEVSVTSIKKSLLDKKHVSLTEKEGNSQFYVLPDLPISTGLNIIIGERSSGKTVTLDKIADQYNNVKYIKQFSLIEKDQKKEAKKFTDAISAKRSSFAEEYFEPFAKAVNLVKDISLDNDEKKIEEYLSSLIASAKEADRADSFAKCRLYNEAIFPPHKFDNIIGIIEAVEKLLDAREYREIIDKHIDRKTLI